MEDTRRGVKLVKYECVLVQPNQVHCDIVALERGSQGILSYNRKHFHLGFFEFY
jgi:hypothetical protein